MVNNSIFKTNFRVNYFLIFIIFLSFFMSPIISFLLSILYIGLIKQPSRLVSILAGFSLGFPALYYVPLSTDDASRIFRVMQSLRLTPVSNLENWLNLWAPDYKNYPIFTGSMYVIARFFQDDVLPFIVAGVSYSVIIYFVYRFSYSFKLSNWGRFLTLFASVVWIAYLELISGMRFTLACCIAILIIQSEFITNDRTGIKSILHWLLFLISILIHPGVLLILFPIGIYVLLSQKGIYSKFLIFVLIGYVITSYVLHMTFLTMLVSKFVVYQTTTFAYVTSTQRIVHVVVAFGIVFFSLLISNFEKKRSGSSLVNGVADRLFKINILYFILMLVMLMSINMEVRIISVMPILAITGISIYFSDSSSSDRNGSESIIVSMILISIIIAGLLYNFNVRNIDFNNIQWLFPFMSSVNVIWA
ncbi:hypothetical protein [Lactiplantibacillus plantarum]|uniref:hypothetical protein n=1 Tax=Lactiplantibacillus plantarum TaxID=1590 RepID=UPI001FCDEBAC|nr:hypothetical protein [Lactiplantibacillus plantarum]